MKFTVFIKHQEYIDDDSAYVDRSTVITVSELEQLNNDFQKIQSIEILDVIEEGRKIINGLS